MMPHSGGLYVSSHKALGYPGFCGRVGRLITSCGTVSASALLIGDVAAGLVPVLHGKACQSHWYQLLFTPFQWSGIRNKQCRRRRFLTGLALGFAPLPFSGEQ